MIAYADIHTNEALLDLIENNGSEENINQLLLSFQFELHILESAIKLAKNNEKLLEKLIKEQNVEV